MRTALLLFGLLYLACSVAAKGKLNGGCHPSPAAPKGRHSEHPSFDCVMEVDGRRLVSMVHGDHGKALPKLKDMSIKFDEDTLAQVKPQVKANAEYMLDTFIKAYSHAKPATQQAVRTAEDTDVDVPRSPKSTGSSSSKSTSLSPLKEHKHGSGQVATQAGAAAASAANKMWEGFFEVHKKTISVGEHSASLYFLYDTANPAATAQLQIYPNHGDPPGHSTMRFECAYKRQSNNLPRQLVSCDDYANTLYGNHVCNTDTRLQYDSFWVDGAQPTSTEIERIAEAICWKGGSHSHLDPAICGTNDHGAQTTGSILITASQVAGRQQIANCAGGTTFGDKCRCLGNALGFGQ